MTRLFVAPERLAAGELELRGDDHRYLARVLRLAAGADVELFDGDGRVATARVVAVTERATRLAVAAPRPAPDRVGPELRVLLPLIKGDRTEWAIQKLVELGVDHVTPIATERGVVRVPADRAEARRARFEAVARGAARQCGRATVPVVAPIAALADAIAARPPGALAVVAWEGERERPLRAALPADPPEAVVVLVGPEGGLTDDELAAAQASGFVPVGLGPRVLRAETAAVAAIAILAHLLGDLG